MTSLLDRWLTTSSVLVFTFPPFPPPLFTTPQGLVKSLLDVADNLERAAAAVPEEAVAPEGADAQRALALLRTLREGVLMTDAVLMRVRS